MNMAVKDARHLACVARKDTLDALAILDPHLLVYPGHACFYQRVVNRHDDRTGASRFQSFGEQVNLLVAQHWRVLVALAVGVQRQELAAPQLNMRVAQHQQSFSVVQNVRHQLG